MLLKEESISFDFFRSLSLFLFRSLFLFPLSLSGSVGRSVCEIDTNGSLGSFGSRREVKPRGERTCLNYFHGVAWLLFCFICMGGQRGVGSVVEMVKIEVVLVEMEVVLEVVVEVWS